MKYALLTFGCRVNQADSMAIERDLRARGGLPVASTEAELVIVNSCSVTATADQGTRQAIRRVARGNPGARIVVTGCYATRCQDELAALPGVVHVAPNQAKDTLVEMLAAPGDLSTAERYAGGDGACGAPFLLDRTALTVRVQTGCEERCSYCIIPTTRGLSRSRPAADVVRELQLAEAAGYREVTLTGVHLGAYGRDLLPEGNLAELLQAVVEGTGRLHIRLGSLEPMDVPDVLVELASDGRIAPSFHLPLQHASDRLLRRMRRPYTLQAYSRLVDAIRARLSHAALGADVIVGFPGETDADFSHLCEYLEGSPLTQLHVFPYSDRPGTEASRMGDRVPGPIIKARGARVREIGKQLGERFVAGQIGSVRPALTIEDGSVAVTDNGMKVRLGAGCGRNRAVQVRLEAGGTGERVVCGEDG